MQIEQDNMDVESDATPASPTDEGADAEIDIRVSIEELLASQSHKELDSLLKRAAECCGYDQQLEVSWSYWHYDTHAIHAECIDLPKLSLLFSVAWQVEHRVFGQDEEAAAIQRDEIRSEFIDNGIWRR